MNPAILVKQVSRYVFDVFGGVGYDQWTRVRKQHWGIVPVAGERITRTQAKQIEQALGSFPNGSNDPIEVTAQ